MDQVTIKNTLIAGVLIIWGIVEAIWWWRGRKGAATGTAAAGSALKSPERWRNIFTFALIAIAVWWITTNGFAPA
ncbi:MAG: hypothetical protein IPG71_03235 [bacterium]|nr:hypothetical protein [bacterium]